MNPVLERFFALPHLPQAQISMLTAQGVPNLALGRDPEGDGYTVAAARVVFDGSRFEFADDVEDAAEAVPALVFVARDECGEVCDLVAARPSAGLIAAWRGEVCLLGQQNAFLPSPTLSGRLQLHAHVLEWLKASRYGAVIVNAEQAAWLLANMPLQTESADYGKKLKRTLRLPGPRIFVPIQKGRAA